MNPDSEKPTSTRESVNKICAAPIAFMYNPLGTIDMHRGTIEQLTQPITLGKSDENKTNVFRAVTQLQRDLAKDWLIRNPRNLVRMEIDIVKKIGKGLEKLVKGARGKIHDALEKRDDK